jgi:hypothetical protein
MENQKLRVAAILPRLQIGPRNLIETDVKQAKTRLQINQLLKN